MKYLLDKNLKVTARGIDLEGDKEHLVYDPDGKNALKDLKAIAVANKIEHPAKIKMSDLALLITETFSNMKLEEYLDVKSLVIAGVKAGKDDDTIMLELINAGVHVRNAWGEFRTALMAAGMLLKPAERNAKLAEMLKDFDPETGTDVTAMIELMKTEIPRTTERQAMAAIRKYATDNKLELPKVKRVAGFKKKMHTWLIEHPAALVDELNKFVADAGKPESVSKRYGEVLILAQKMAERINAE